MALVPAVHILSFQSLNQRCRLLVQLPFLGIDYNRIIPKQQEQAKWGERLGYSKEITADKGNRKNREKSRIQRQTRSEK